MTESQIRRKNVRIDDFTLAIEARGMLESLLLVLILLVIGHSKQQQRDFIDIARKDILVFAFTESYLTTIPGCCCYKPFLEDI